MEKREELQQEKKKWLEEVYGKICTKMSAECTRVGDRIPYIPENGRYEGDLAETDVCWWTNGFWGGILWQMYHATGEEKYRLAAEGVENKMDAAFTSIGKLNHDVGFMWLHTAVADYRLTGNPKSRERGENAANILAGRFNPLGKFIRAWNGDSNIGWMIIDCMMNIPLLYWMSGENKDPRFKSIALMHADTAMEKLVRPDGSCNHIGIMDPLTGDLLEAPGGQGYGENSSWSRGQAWALYGFALSYHHTKEEKYLDTAKRVAHYFIANAAMTDYLPLCDFRAPEEPVYYGSTAGACAACGLLEIARFMPENEKKLYEDSAYRILRAMEEHFANWDENADAILEMGKVAYHGDAGQEAIIYGDYFFIEAILRMLDKDCFIW